MSVKAGYSTNHNCGDSEGSSLSLLILNVNGESYCMPKYFEDSCQQAKYMNHFKRPTPTGLTWSDVGLPQTHWSQFHSNAAMFTSQKFNLV